MRSACQPLALLVLLGAGCVNVEAYTRGEVVPTQEILQRKDDLPGLIEEKLAAGEPEAAFYALEVHRTRRLGGQRIGQSGRKVPAPYKSKELHELLYLHGRASSPRHPDGPLDGAKQKRLNELRAAFVAAGRAGDEAFWKEYRIAEARLAAYSQEAKILERPYSSIYRDASLVVSAQDVRLGLSPEEGLVEYWMSPRRACALVIRSEGLTVVDLPADAARLAREVEAFRRAIESEDPAWEAPARRLFELLLAPVAPHLQGVETLFLVPHAALANLPFQALVDPQGRTALERWRLSLQPSFSFYKSLTGRPPVKDPPRVMALGHDTLRTAMKEAEKMGMLFPGSEAWLPVADSPHPPLEELFYRRVKEFNVLHLATHGACVAEVPLASNLSLYGDGQYQDGHLTAAEIRTLDLAHTQVVFLSACMSAQSGHTELDSDLASLAGAFMTAGAPTVVGSLWPVDDLATGRIALRFYQLYLELGPAEALRRAALEIKGGAILRRHALPKYWAPFNVYGMDR